MDSFRICPVGIEIIMHCHYSTSPDPMRGTQIYEDCIEEYKKNGLIKWRDDWDTWITTEKGRAWVELICSTPYPVPTTKWLDPRTNESISSM